MEQEIREIGMRIQDIPITHSPPRTSPPLSDRMENLSVCVNTLCLPGCTCVFYFLADGTRSADGGKDSKGIDIHLLGASLKPDMSCSSQ